MANQFDAFPVTRFQGGVTNIGPNKSLSNIGQLDPTVYHTYFNDFDTYVAGDWTVTETQAGATQALTAGDGGLLLLTNSAADNDIVLLQNSVATYLMESGKKAAFKARFKVSDATQSDFILGLVIVDTTPLDATDGIYFMKDDGDAQLDFYCRKDATTGSNSVTNIATVSNDTYLSVGWYYDGQGRVFYFVNDTLKGSLDASSTYLPDANLCVTFAIQNGEAVAKTMTVDYVYATKQR